MTTRLNPYLSFRDNAREAMDFYESVFGGELTRSTFGEFGASDDPAEQDKVMHSMLVTDNGLTLMGLTHRTAWTSLPVATGRSRSAARTRPSCAATGRSCRMAAMSRCHSRRRRGETRSACVSTSSV